VTRPLSPVHTPAFWLLLAVTGVAGLGVLLVGAFLVYLTPRTGAVVLPLTLAYAAVWVLLLLWLADRVERRPVWLVAVAVSWGGTVSVLVGAASGYFQDNLIAKAISPTFAATWGAAFVGPTAEEPAKAAGVVLLLLAARPYLVSAWSGAIYGALVGVGFAAVEDAGYGMLYADLALPDDVRAGVSVAVLRFLVPGLVGHPLFTAAAGAGIAYAWVSTDRSRGRRLAVLAGGLAAAWLLHFVVNSPMAQWALEASTNVAWAGDWTGYFLVVVLPAVPVLWWLARLRPIERPAGPLPEAPARRVGRIGRAGWAATLAALFAGYVAVVTFVVGVLYP
jgi:RsiW-degrading membrane proteinase PrsW (M82 family)